VLDKFIHKGGGGGGDTVEASPTLSDSCFTLAHILVKTLEYSDIFWFLFLLAELLGNDLICLLLGCFAV
jgi:hypothetical protein